jgi:hypothetical protein
VRNDKPGLWDSSDLQVPNPEKYIISPLTADWAELDDSLGSCKSLLKSIVRVESYMILHLDGIPNVKKYLFNGFNIVEMDGGLL